MRLNVQRVAASDAGDGRCGCQRQAIEHRYSRGRQTPRVVRLARPPSPRASRDPFNSRASSPRVGRTAILLPAVLAGGRRAFVIQTGAVARNSYRNAQHFQPCQESDVPPVVHSSVPLREWLSVRTNQPQDREHDVPSLRAFGALDDC